MQQPIIRKCTIDDAPVIREIGRRTFFETFRGTTSSENMDAYLEKAFNLEQLERELSNPSSEFFLLYDDHASLEPAGYLKINTGGAQTEDMGDDALEVERLYVKREFQKRGFGKMLMTHALDIARRQGKKKVWLGVWEHNDNALAFYKRMGFVQTGSHSFFVGDDEQTDLIMTRTLE
ncbi:MAG: GNAT family acetyltransferase [Thermobacillus sp. ZCTH02-B1]|mgnify:CR=1 FL=1|uniref:GNAT family N-acetyltransferase n=1 Tax=Thermobacillus sp. ZCTH02-B1 TaxID=1858795 RepID=UPI000B54FFBB|nr:GNAT family N-acetyltransferase [Thermobacillus sp. ZCTH02-B1]OUM95648.1 MAG: GNAT family acetyltransferase [Thermobacillus sp. ZCTH02-B1]